MEIKQLEGKVIKSITGGLTGGDEIIFTCEDGSIFKMHHEQECCESVTIEDTDGDLQDLVGQYVIDASERTQSQDANSGGETWTFYIIRTVKTSITIRWYGVSNGYYSESVSFTKID